MPYKLSAQLHAHSSDVRAVASPDDATVLSVSRDKTAVSWSRPAPSAAFAREAVFQAGSKYVNAVAYIHPSPDAPKGYLVTGGADTVINVYDLSSTVDEPKHLLLGHSENVCALHATPSGLIISGSWDRTAKVWRNFQEVYELRGHQHSVWAVLAIDDETFLTGSADNTIKLWKQHKCIKTFTGHTSAVRGLALVPDIGFVSCSNDSEVRVWTTEGDVVYTLSGHTSFVYSVAVLPNGDIASGGEDRTVRIWQDGECIQTIVHPSISVWTVSAMPNGDIVSGASDGVVRVFSASEERWASAEDLKQYEETVASQALSAQQIGDVKKADLPGPEALSAPGSKSGEVKMIRVNDSVEAHQWDTATNSWQKIGDVVDAVGSGRRQLYEGKEYDYVFDVDVQEGVPPLKLPYNANENPHAAAQRFLHANDLPMSYVDQIVAFIEKNTEGVTLSSNESYSDPFTGASRYRSGPTSVPTAGSASFSDPFTGGSRYTPAGTNVPATSQTQGGLNSSSIIPVRTCLSFKQANVPAMRGKIMQLDEAFQNEISTSGLAMYPEETESLEETLTFLTEATQSTGAALATAPLTETHLETIIQVLERWPSSSRFPVIDVARLVSGYCPSSYANPTRAESFFGAVMKAADWSEPWELPIPKSRETNILLALRAVANAFQESTNVNNLDWVAEIAQEISKAPYAAMSKGHHIALTTFLFNLSCVRLKGPISARSNDWHLALMSLVLKEEKSDAEAAYRALVSLGNALFALKSQKASLSPGQTSDFREAVSTLKIRFPEDRIATVSRDIESLL